MDHPPDTLNLAIRQYPTAVERHSHLHHQVVLSLHGKLDIEIEQCTGQVKEGVGAFIAAGDVHHFSSKGENEFIILDFPVRKEDQKCAKKANIPAFFPLGRDIQGLVDYVLAARKQGAFLQSMGWAWSSLLIERLQAHGLVSHGGDNTLDRAIAFIQTRLSQRINIADIAAACGLSASKLHAVFRDQLATTPHAYLMALRVDEAVRLLTTTELGIAEIALRTGHTDQSALTHALRRARNQTPRALRQHHRRGRIEKA